MADSNNNQAFNQASDIGRQFKNRGTAEEDIHFFSELKPASAPLRSLEGEEEAKFVLREVAIEGNTIFSQSELSSFWNSYLNKEVSIADLHKVSQMIAQHYREDGYVLAQVLVPEQDIVPDEGKNNLASGGRYVGRCACRRRDSS